MMSDEKKAVTDDSDSDGCVGDEDQDDTQMMHKNKTAGILALLQEQLTTGLILW